MLTINLHDRTAIVIGGARGIGACICRMIGQAGGKVAWTHLGNEADRAGSAELGAMLKKTGTEYFERAVNCMDAEATEAFIHETMIRWQELDYLVYCAGLTTPVSFLDISPDEWRRHVEINLTGVYLALRVAIPAIIKVRRGGAIVLVGSAAIVSGGGGRADYISAKAGLEGLNRAITKEFAPQGIRCNLVHPSLIETDLLKQRYPDAAAREAKAGDVPLRRLGRPEDIAHAVVFLLSDGASYITGQSLFVDGGRTFCR